MTLALFRDACRNLMVQTSLSNGVLELMLDGGANGTVLSSLRNIATGGPAINLTADMVRSHALHFCCLYQPPHKVLVSHSPQSVGVRQLADRSSSDSRARVVAKQGISQLRTTLNRA